MCMLVKKPIQWKTLGLPEFRNAMERFSGLLRESEALSNSRSTGLWLNVCQVLAVTRRRCIAAQREIVREAQQRELEESAVMFFKTEQRTSDYRNITLLEHSFCFMYLKRLQSAFECSTCSDLLQQYSTVSASFSLFKVGSSIL